MTTTTTIIALVTCLFAGFCVGILTYNKFIKPKPNYRFLNSTIVISPDQDVSTIIGATIIFKNTDDANRFFKEIQHFEMHNATEENKYDWYFNKEEQ